jgi:polyhydroxybutyrate depolymerase
MRAAIVATLILFGLGSSACSSSSHAKGGGGSSSASSGSGGAGGGGPPVVGGDRPVTVDVPPSYDPKTPAPLLIMLHGYSVDGTVEELYLQLAPVARMNGFFYAHPDGTLDSMGFNFWNATDACCNYDGSTVDDSAYLASVVADIQKRWNIDPKRIYFLGHSNGGFMSYRMACDHADTIAAIVSLAGAMWEDTSKCQPTEPVNLLEIHGTSDTEVLYNGFAGTSMPGNGPYPAAPTSVKDWATFDGCGVTPDTSAPPLDLDEEIPGAETTVSSYAMGCKAGGSATLWTITGGMHVPNIGDTFRSDVFSFFLAHPKP